MKGHGFYFSVLFEWRINKERKNKMGGNTQIVNERLFLFWRSTSGISDVQSGWDSDAAPSIHAHG